MTPDDHKRHYRQAALGRMGLGDDGRVYGYVYAIGRADTSEVKIGWSCDPLTRFNTLQSAHAAPLRMLLVFATNDPADEARAHTRFAEDWIAREWFRRTPAIETWIANGHQNAVTEEWLRTNHPIKGFAGT